LVWSLKEGGVSGVNRVEGDEHVENSAKEREAKENQGRKRKIKDKNTRSDQSIRRRKKEIRFPKMGQKERED